MPGTPKTIGRILMIPQGNYDPSTKYDSLDWVRHDNKAWLCKLDGTIGITPVEGANWTLLVEDGRGIVNIQLTGTDPSNPLKDIYTITYTDGTTSTFTVTNGTGGGGSGSGDMTKSEYAPSGVHGKVDHAINADNVGNADTSLLEKLSDNAGKLNYNGNALMLEMAQLANQAKLGEFVVNQISNNVKELALHSNITTKLPKSVPTTSDAGKVATVQSDGTVDWETPSTSITEPTDLEKGIIGGDAWTAKSYTAGSTVIYNNKIYSCIADCGASNLPTDTTYWEETSLSALNSKKINKPVSATENQVLTFKNNEWVADSKAPKLLWENPSPSATFSAQLITLNSSDFDFYVIYYIYDNSHLDWLGSMWGIAGLGIMTFMNDSSGNRFQRNYKKESDTTLNITECKMNGSVRNEYMIPYKIYGYKY